MRNAFHNTTEIEGEELKQAQKIASGQDQEVLRIYRNLRQPMSAEVVHSMYSIGKKRNVPLTSIRRAISNLTKAGYLEKTDETETSQYGRTVHKWRVRR